MAKTIKPLTDLEIKSFIKDDVKGKKLFDGGGLFLHLPASGYPAWRVKYRLGDKERVYTIGAYPQISLQDARIELAKIREQVKRGHDPVQQRQVFVLSNQDASENTFQVVADQWLAKMKKEWGAVHYQKAARAIERDLYPKLSNLPIETISPFVLAQSIAPTVHRGAIETADRILQHAGAIFNFAKGLGVYAGDNPVPGAREVVLPKVPESKRMPAITEWQGLGAILRNAKGANISPPLYLLHRLLAFTATRIGTARLAEWAEFDLDSTPPVWTIPRAKMKVKTRHTDHRIPLSASIAQDLREWRSIGLSKRLVFPSPQTTKEGQPIGSEGLEKAYRDRLGLAGKHTPHGWRAAFSTLARDENFNRDVVELALDHCHDDDVAMAYDRGERWLDRVKLFDWWGERLVKAES